MVSKFTQLQKLLSDSSPDSTTGLFNVKAHVTTPSISPCRDLVLKAYSVPGAVLKLYIANSYWPVRSMSSSPFYN